VRSHFAVLVLCMPLLMADQVTLKNGDTITGEIIKKDGDKLTMKSSFLGDITMPWSAVASIKSDGPLYVALPGGQETSGKLLTEGSTLQVQGAGASQSVPLANVQAIRDEKEEKEHGALLSPGLLELWSGYFDLGFALARGNAHTETLNTSFHTSRITRNDEITADFTQIYSTARVAGVNAATAQAERGGWTYSHNLSPRLFFNTLNDYESDHFQDLNLRFVAGGGLGFHLTKSERRRLDVVAGADYDHDSFFNNLTRSTAEGFWGDDLSIAVSTSTSLTQSFRMFDNLSNTGQYRMNFDLGAATTLKKWLSWQLTASDRFLSNPVFGRQKNDILLTTGFRLSFAR